MIRQAITLASDRIDLGFQVIGHGIITCDARWESFVISVLRLFAECVAIDRYQL